MWSTYLNQSLSMQILVFFNEAKVSLSQAIASDILNLLWSWESAIQMWTGHRMVPGGSAGNQDGCHAGAIYLKKGLGSCSQPSRGSGRRTGPTGGVRTGT